jgi:hypothetical protein
MKSCIFFCALVTFVLAAGCGVKNTPVAEKVAMEKAKYWLEVIDTDTLGGAYDIASPVLKRRYDREDWIHDLETARQPFGLVASRSVDETSNLRTELEGYPPGEYIVVEFETIFQDHREGREIVVMRKGEDGEWRAANYHLEGEVPEKSGA